MMVADPSSGSFSLPHIVFRLNTFTSCLKVLCLLSAGIPLRRRRSLEPAG